MKGNTTLTILKLIQSGDMVTKEILDTITYFGYNETYRRMKGMKSLIPERKLILQKTIKNIRERQKISKMLYKLKEDGLIFKEENNGDDFWKNTDRGEKRLTKLKTKIKTYSNIKQSAEIKIITFDIPETKRFLRDWLRKVLKNLNFKMLQKSVWIGKTILPEEFLDDLKHLELLSHVEIFAITKTGTIKQIQ